MNRGQWQAQGNDIPNPGHSVSWNPAKPPTKSDGLRALGLLAGQCTGEQRKLREAACAKAKRYVRTRPRDGVEHLVMKSFWVDAPPTRARKARVDLEVTYGRAFVDDPAT